MNNPLQKIFSGISQKLPDIFNLSKARGTALGIDIGTSSIKVVELKRKGSKVILETYGSLALGPYGGLDIGAITNLSPQDISRALIDVLKESHVTSLSGIISIPSSSSLIFTISLPSAIKEEELKNIIPIEARKYIPVPISEVSLDWFVLPQESDSPESDLANKPIDQQKTIISKIEVMVVAIHNDILSRYQEILTKSNLQPKSFEMEIFSNIRSSFSHDLTPILLMDFGASKTKISIIEKGMVRVFHIINRGGFDITKNIASSLGISFTEAEKLKRSINLKTENSGTVADIIRLSLDYIFANTNSIVFDYQKKYNKSISKVILTGGGSLISGLQSRASSNFAVEVISSNPFSKTEAPAFLDEVLRASGPEFSVACGLALRDIL